MKRILLWIVFWVSIAGALMSLYFALTAAVKYFNPSPPVNYEKLCADVGGEMMKFRCTKDDRFLEDNEWIR